MMPLPRARVLAFLGAALLAPGASAGAQSGTVAVYVAEYSPTQDLFQITKGSGAGNFRMQSAPSRGGALGVKINRRVGVVLSGGEVNTAMAFTPAGSGAVTTQDAALKHASLQGAFGLTPGNGPVQPFVSVGLGYVQRSGEAFAGHSNLSNYGLSIGAGFEVRVAMFAVTLGAEVMDYSATYELPGQPSRYFLQRDAQLRLGAGLAVGN